MEKKEVIKEEERRLPYEAPGFEVIDLETEGMLCGSGLSGGDAGDPLRFRP